jgi:phosphohistidine phosphatase
MAREDDIFPEQAAAIAIRRRSQGLEVCLIRRRGARWGIPKGMVDPGDTHEETALKEAWEEAGLEGRLLGDCVGTYEYAKWDTVFTVAVYVMEVLRAVEAWDEAPIRERRWAPFDTATTLLATHPVRALVNRVGRLHAAGVLWPRGGT